MKHFKSLLFLCLAVLLLASQAFAQDGTILGTVTDSSGSVMPNVTISITNLDTGQVRTTTSNQVGLYVVPEIHIGKYTLKAEASGFKTAERQNVVLAVGDRLRLDFQLVVGDTKESMTVTAEAIRVQADSSEVSDVITGMQVSQLAVNSRNLYQLATLTTGASAELMGDFNMPTPVGSNANISFNGQRPDHNVWMVDGGENYDRGSGGKMAIMPSMDAIAEFRAMTSNYSAEYGLASGATMSFVFKSGTRDFHGTLWEYFRNDALDAADFFTNMAGNEKQVLRFNTYGFNLGGPVILPHYNKERNKTFFFYNQEWRKIRQGGSVNANTAPQAWRDGDFSSLLPSTKLFVPTNISAAEVAKFAQYNLKPGDAFPGNKIPSGLFDANALSFLKTGALPLPNSGTKYIGGNTLPTDVREELVRIDHQFSDKFSIFGHWVSEAISQTYGTSMWSGDSYPGVGSIFGNPSYSGVIHTTYVINPNLLNEAAFNYNGNRIHIDPTGTYKRPADMNIPELYSSNALNRIPVLNWQKQMNTAYDTWSQPWSNKADDYQFRDDFSWTKGRHAMKFGGQYMRYNKVQDLFGNTQGNFSFNGSFTGSDFADFLLGYASNYQELALQDNGRWDSNTFSAYAQDNYKVNSRLTLNLGLRWEGIPHTFEENDRMSDFYPNLWDPSKAARFLPDNSLDPTGPGFTTVPGVPLSSTPFYMNGVGLAGKGVPRGLVKDQWNNWAPRIGFAYDIAGNGKTVLRAGFGVMYERIQGNDVYNGGANAPFSYAPSVSNVFLSNPAMSITTGAAAAAPVFPAGIYALSNTNYKPPTSDQWSFGIQRELARGTVLSVAYVGNKNTHQNVQRDINAPLLSDTRRIDVVNNKIDVNTIRPYAGFSNITLVENSTNSNYNSVQANFRMDMAKGLTLQAAYTYSKVMAYTAAGVGGGDLVNASNPYDLRYDRGPAPMDRTHVFILNYVYQLPFFNDSQSRAVKGILGGWQVSGITSAVTGFPLTATTSNSSLGMGGNVTNRPNLISPINYPHTRTEWFSTDSFAAPASLMFGSAGKGVIRGPGRQNWDISLFKAFSGIPWPGNPEGAKVEFRVETFNTFNHTQWNAVSTSYTAGDFGQVTSTFNPRTVQLGLRFAF